MIRKLFNEIQDVRNKAASRLQRSYKRYRLLTLIPKTLKANRNK